MKKLFLLLFGLSITTITSAQEVTPVKGFWSDPFSDPMFPLYVVTSLVVIVLVLVMVVVFYMLRTINIFIQKETEHKAVTLGQIYKPAPSVWNHFWERMNAVVPIEKEETIQLDHNFDGIKELDNHLPPWWKWLFYGTIGWGIIYLIVFHVTYSLPLSHQEYDEEVAVAQEHLLKLRASQPAIAIDERTLTFTNDAALIASGKKIFTSNCASCHKENGGGSVGPNLTDEYWLHGGEVKDIYATIKNGVPEKGMISWAPVLKPDEIRDAAFYIMSLRGTKPAGAKSPQGDLLKSEKSTPVKQDSVKAQASL